jgi:hypothetical protein
VAAQHFDRQPYLAALHNPVQFHAYGRCDWFAAALCEAAGWPVVAVASPGQRAAHRLNRDPRGRRVSSASGLVMLVFSRRRYGVVDLEIVEGGRIPRGNAPGR